MNYKLWYDDESGKKIDTAKVSNIFQTVWKKWKLYTEMLNYLDESLLDKVRLDDYNVYMIIWKIQKNKRDIVWSADFNQQRDIRVLRTNYNNEIVMINNIDKNCYVIFKSYYQLCEEEKREADIKMYYNTH